MNGSISTPEPAATRESGELIADRVHQVSAGSADWGSRSVCRGEDPELFFPAARSLTLFVQLAKAKAICGRCPVSRECLRYALATGQQHGVWGGKSEEERRALRHRLPVGAPTLPLEQVLPMEQAG